MKIHDITGTICEGIWKYGDSYPDYHPEHTSSEPGKCFFEIFHGMNSQTGTYLETTAHNNGYEKTRLIADVPANELVNIPCRVLHIDQTMLHANNGKITAEMLEAAASGLEIPHNCAILLDSGWDNWNAPDFLSAAPYLSLSAMQRLLAWEPSLIGSDTPAWQKDEPVFDLFTQTDILLLAPLVGLADVDGCNAELTVLPLKIEHTCAAPARAVIVEPKGE